ncbi:MAG: hypothetical protein WD872_15945 [Pirellulaceae bacterium]
MHDRQRALRVLQESREVLAQRLTERVLDEADEILADARGDSYMNEIESLYEQLGMKLSHVGQMISHLPAEGAEPATTTAAAEHASQETFTLATEGYSTADGAIADGASDDRLPAIAGPMYVAAFALPPPGGAGSTRAKATQLSLQAFAAQIQAGDLRSAGRTIGALFELEAPRAIACAAAFAQRARTEAGFFRRMLGLGSELQSGDSERASALLVECFGLSPADSTEVLQTLQRRLGWDH